MLEMAILGHCLGNPQSLEMTLSRQHSLLLLALSWKVALNVGRDVGERVRTGLKPLYLTQVTTMRPHSSPDLESLK